MIVRRVGRFVGRSVLLWLIVLSAIAFFWPELNTWLGVAVRDPFAATHQHRLLKPLFAAAMFVIGCLLPSDEIRQVLRTWPTVLGGTAVQYLAMPLLAFGAAQLFPLSEDLRLGLIVVGCVPGAMASNVVTLLARGNVSYSVSLTTSATLLSPFVVPLLLAWLLAGRVEGAEALKPVGVFLDLLATVAGPVLAGHLACRALPLLGTGMQAYGPAIANAVILWIIAVVVGLNRDRLGDVTGLLLVALLLVNLLGYAAGWLAGTAMRLSEPMRRALTIEIGMQNAGLGTVLVLTFLHHRPAAAIPTAAYTFGCMLTGTLLAQMWARRVEG